MLWFWFIAINPGSSLALQTDLVRDAVREHEEEPNNKVGLVTPMRPEAVHAGGDAEARDPPEDEGEEESLGGREGDVGGSDEGNDVDEGDVSAHGEVESSSGVVALDGGDD